MKKFAYGSMALFAGLAMSVLPHTAEAGRAGGSKCVDVALKTSCSANVISVTGTVTNCGTASDSINLSEVLTDPNGAVISSQGASISLRAGKSLSYTLNEQVPADVAAGTYTLTVKAVTQKGGATDTAVATQVLPCP